jgi:hypothetical protein
MAGLTWSIIKTRALISEIRFRFGLSIDLIHHGKFASNNLESYILLSAGSLEERTLASVHKYLRLCDLCKELAFGTQRADW